MLKRLRLQFVAVIMVIVTIMLCTVFGMLYFFTRSSLEQEKLCHDARRSGRYHGP